MTKYAHFINSLPDKEWLIFDRLNSLGFPTYIVGGAVRDAVLGEVPKDIDIATKATPEEIANAFKEFPFPVDYVGASFGVMMIAGIEVATFRGDRYFGGGDKDVEITYVDTIQEDLARRDFTVNAMAIDIHGNLIDPFGGIEAMFFSDLGAMVIRFVGDALTRIDEDPNRMLRAFRFAARFNATLAPSTYIAIDNSRHKWNMIAPERARAEIMKTMESCRHASIFWEYARKLGALDVFLPELAEGYEHDHGNHHSESVWDHNMVAGDSINPAHPLVKLAAYLHDVGKPASFDTELGTFYEHHHFGADIVRERLTELKFSNDEVRFVTNLVLVHMDGTRGMTPKARRRLKNKLNAYGLDWRDYLRVRMSDRTGNENRPNFTISDVKCYIEQFNISEEVPFSVNDLAVSGGGLIQIFELKPGPLVGQIQRELLKAVIDKGEEWNTPYNLVSIAMDEFHEINLNKKVFTDLFVN